MEKKEKETYISLNDTVYHWIVGNEDRLFDASGCGQTT